MPELADSRGSQRRMKRLPRCRPWSSLALVAATARGRAPSRLHDRRRPRRAASGSLAERGRRRTLPGSISFSPHASPASPSAALVPAALGALAARGRGLRDPVAGARRDQQGRVELRPQHGPELGGRDRLDAVHALDVAALGVDANGDGVADPWNAEDAIFSAARYLAAAGGQTDISRGRLRVQPRRLVRRRGAAARAALYGHGGVDVDLQRSTGCRSRSAARRTRSPRRTAGSSPRSAQARGRSRARARAQANGLDGAALLSDRLALEQASRSQVGVAARRGAVAPAAAALGLAGAAGSSTQARTTARAPRRSRPAARRCSAPRLPRAATSSRSAAARRSSRSAHTHHDYPAADIAAPEGSPVYALADARRPARLARARRALRDRPDDAHGRRPDLDVLPPLLPRAGVRDGRRRPRGRARRSGSSARRATRPARTCTSSSSRRRRYPQDQPWFQRFAGVAFRWQDGGATDAETQAPVFAVVPAQPVVPSGPVVLFTR